MNYMKQVADMLGVEMGERFYLTDENDGRQRKEEYCITDEGLMREGFVAPQGRVLAGLLVGKIEVVKKPWKLKKGDSFYFVSPKGKIHMSIFDDSAFSFMCLYMGNYFRTPEEALAHKDEVMAKFKAVME